MEFPSIQFPGYFIEYSSRNKGSNHIFCGEHKIKGAECPNCLKSLLRFATIDLNNKETKINLKGTNKVHLLYCWTCNVAYEWFFYKLKKPQEIEIIKYGEGGVQQNFPYDDYPIFFPEARASLKRIPKRIQSVLSKLNSFGQEDYSEGSEEQEYARPKHQLGGEPYFVQYFIESKCPECDISMPFLASIADDCLDSRGMAGNPFVQVIFVLCIKCKIIGVTHDCD